MVATLTKGRFWDVALSVLGIAAAISCLAAALYLSGSVNVALEKLQNEYSVSRIASVLQAIDQNTQHLGEYTAGYAMWDDAYQFLQHRNPEFLQTNYAEPVLAATPVQLVGIYDLNGDLVFSAALNEESKSVAAPAALNEMPGLEDFASLQKPGSVKGRIEWIGERAYIVAICPITDSAGTAPIRGYLLFGSIVGKKMLAQLETLTGSLVSIEAGLSMPKGDFQITTTDLGTAEVTIGKRNGVWDSKAFALFREDNAEQQSVGFRIELPAAASQTGRELSDMIRSVFLLVAAGFAVFVGLAIREILRRREEISRRIRETEAVQAARLRADQLADKAAAADRAKSAFLAMISHEIRTPLNAIIGYADLLRRDPDEELAERLEIVSRSGSMLQHIVDDILDFSRIEAGRLDIRPRATDVRDLIDEIVRTFERSAELRGDLIITTIDPAVPEFLQLDDVRVKQVLGNLVSNAVKFTNGGSIMISVSCEAGLSGKEGQTLVITVDDEGIGVAAGEEAALFEPFSQADSTASRRYQGTGLGLVICRRLCSLMGGTISFQRRLVKGSTFKVCLPARAAESAEKSPDSDPPSHAVQHDDMTILIVDDNVVNGRLLKAVLKRMGRTAETVVSGRKAIDHFKAKPFDVIFMDIHMPGMDGIATTQEIRKLEKEMNRPRCFIVAVTADSLVTDSAQTRAASMDGHINKPIRIVEIEETLSRLSQSNRER